MSLSVICYPQPDKPKSRHLCKAFAEGSKGIVDQTGQLDPSSPAAFYGVMGIEKLFQAAQRHARAWYYMDNAFFDRARQVFFRVTKDGFAPRMGKADAARLSALGLEIQPWKRDGRHIVVVAQSEHFMRHVAAWPGGANGWQEEVLTKLKRHTDRPIVVRHWSRDKTERARTLQQELAGAWALVTHASAAANEALLAGIPVFVTGPCAALPMGLSQLESIETPRRPDGRHEWAATLAAQQWTVDEIRGGMAWRALNG